MKQSFSRKLWFVGTFVMGSLLATQLWSSMTSLGSENSSSSSSVSSSVGTKAIKNFCLTNALVKQFQGLFDQDGADYVTESFMPPHLTVPALSLERFRKISMDTLIKGNPQSIVLMSISDTGDLFFMGHKNDEPAIFILNSQKDQKCTCAELEIVALKDGWGIINSLRFTGLRKSSHIPLVRSIVSESEETEDQDESPHIELGSFDVNSRSIHRIGFLSSHDVIDQLNSQSAVILRSINWYFVNDNQRISISGTCALDPQHSRILSQDSTKHITDLLHPTQDLVIPESKQAVDEKSQVELLTGNGDPHLQLRTINKRSVASWVAGTTFHQWSYDQQVGAWQKHFEYQLPRTNLCLSIDTRNEVALNTGFTSYPYAIALGTGKIVRDYEKAAGRFAYSMASRNGRYIAMQTFTNDILIWKVRGINLLPSCTFTDRLDLHELDEMYRIGQERNEKYDRNYVIRLNARQWKNFKQLSERPECQVPHDWARLFRQLKS